MDDLSQISKWWHDHVGHTRRYVNGIFNKEPEKAHGALHGLWKGVHDWKRLSGVPGSAPLMGEHAILVKTLVDAGERGFRPGETENLVDYLKKNSKAQADLYGQKIPGFPKDEWKKLFDEHIDATGAEVVAAAKGDTKGFHENWKKILENRDKLSAFSDKAFSRGMGDEEYYDGLGDEEYGDGVGDEGVSAGEDETEGSSGLW